MPRRGLAAGRFTTGRFTTAAASAVAAVALFAGAAVPAVAFAPVASAHSVLVSVDPEDGARLDASPEQVVLTFNEEVNQSFASVAVTAGDDRTNRVTGEPSVDGSTVTAELPDLAPGAYTVGYRITSADGHVVSGSSVFTVAGDGAEAAGSDGAGAAGDSATNGAEAAGSDGAGAAGAAGSDGVGQSDDTADAEITDQAADEDSSGVNPALWVVGGLAVLLIGGAFFLLRRGS